VRLALLLTFTAGCTIEKAFPADGERRLFRLSNLYKFQCTRCRATKKSKLVAVTNGDWSALMCNGCHGG